MDGAIECTGRFMGGGSGARDRRGPSRSGGYGGWQWAYLRLGGRGYRPAWWGIIMAVMVVSGDILEGNYTLDVFSSIYGGLVEVD